MLHIEVRKKILEASEKGLSVKEICTAYATGKTSVYALLKLERESGDITPKTHLRGRKPTWTQEDLAAIERQLKEQKDITVAQLKTKLGLTVSESTIRTMIHEKLGYHLKKRQYTPASGSGQT
jgi:transposase